MEDRQKENILHMYSRLQNLEKAVSHATKGSRAVLKKQLDDAERHFSSIMSALPANEWEEIDALLRKGKRSSAKRAKRNQSKSFKPSSVRKVATPDKDIQAVLDRFQNKGLLNGFKMLKQSSISYPMIEPYINEIVQDAVDHGRIGEVLSLIYESGRLFNQDIIILLRELYRRKDYPTLLKQAYRFNVYSELKEEIDQAIQWHKDTEKPDAFAWRVKYDNLVNEEQFQSSAKESVVKICEEESIKKKQFVTLKLTPISRTDGKTAAAITEDTERYVNIQYNKCMLDKANASHQETQKVLESYLDMFLVPHKETRHIDVYADINGVQHIFEVKSITLRNESTQTREGVGQLHEYAFLYGIETPRFYLVYSSKPETEWLLDFLETREGIHVIWLDDSQPYKLAGPGLKALEQECLRHYKAAVKPEA